ncbi:FMN-dependent dehydrogenase-domain-containing protein [Ilyonectria robusta]|uniref:FMN-dependent dehydrogenase-domain-containing protein n=1 Tax=Ilyonectria robusta TaxID=1079257 RepID=UPI001E8D642C|nr:FMN-dependent dehydrogenase-domain-containing protein [Ilyonectria robusta]KAH8665330.1 FMN-dependent dehydrogenase-domain-containing protein [Ilyonectria robusta]
MGETITACEVARHNKTDDVWVVVDGEVFDMTAFAPEHPGGPEIIYQYAGRDASSTYNEVHAPSLIRRSLDAKAHIGTLDASSITDEWKNANAMTIPQADDAKGKANLEDIINLDDFEAAAATSLSRKSMAFIHSGSNDNITRDANREFLKRVWLRPAVMRNVSSVNTSTTLFGCKLDIPVYIAPTGGAKTGGSEGELTLARGAAAGGIIHCFATPSSYPYSEILEETAKHAFFQLYVNKDRKQSEAAVRQVVASGKIKAIFVTADVPVVPKREEDERVRSAETQAIAGIKVSVGGKDTKGAGFARLASSFIDSSLSWDDIKWLRSLTSVPILVKGIQRAEDAKIAYEIGCDGVVLSNHGGRAADNAPPAILVLLELHKSCPEVLGAMEILVDGGFRRGSDVVKAICLGASAVGFGRSFLYALGYGEEGIERAIEIIKDEVETTMRLCGITDLMRDAHPRYVNTKDIDHLVPDEGHSYVKRVLRRSARL